MSHMDGPLPFVPTAKEDWARSELYHNNFLLKHDDDEALQFVVENSKAKGLPNIAVSAAHGRLLKLLVKTMNAKRIVEVGTLAG